MLVLLLDESAYFPTSSFSQEKLAIYNPEETHFSNSPNPPLKDLSSSMILVVGQSSMVMV